MADTAPSNLNPRSTLMNNRSTSASVLSPKGILKNKVGPQESRSPHLTWDEPNLALNDLNRDSTMKITEPKTPFVRYNAENDEVMDLESIPDFDLGRASSSSSSHQTSVLHNEPMVTEASHSRAQNPPPSMQRCSSSTSRRGSGSTERKVLVQPPAGGPTAGDDALDDEEDGADLDPEAKAKHDAFVRARKGHHGNEAEAMKKARELAEKEEIESEATVESDQPSDSSNSEAVHPVPNGA